MKKIFTPIILILAATQCMASGSDSTSAADTSRTMTLRDCMEYAMEQEHTPTVTSDVQWTLKQTLIPIPHLSTTVTR